VAGQLARLTGAIVIRLDAINHEFGIGLEGAEISADEWQRTYDEAYRRIAQQLVAGVSVIFDHGNFSRAERDQVRVIGARAGAQVQFMYVPVSRDEARGRLLVNRQTSARHDVRDDNFEQAVSIFEPPDSEPDVLNVQHPGPDLGWLVGAAARRP
jgi:predicted kinase